MRVRLRPLAAAMIGAGVLAAAPVALDAQQMPPAPGPTPAPANASAQVQLGHYLTVVGDCEGCHNRPGGQAYAGGVALPTPFGTIYSANITQDRETGIGAWTADQFWNAMHNGVRADGAKLYPAFPYVYFTHITRGESDAIYAYLKTVPAVSYRPPSNKLPFPLNIRALVAFWNVLYFKPDNAPSIGPSAGQHIVQGLGHCGGCHTPKTFLGGDKAGHELEGGKLDNWFAPALNADVRTGLGAWSTPDVAEYLKTSRNARANASASMGDVIHFSTSQMTDADLAAVGDYLRSHPNHAPAPSARQPDAKVMAAGEAIYVDECSACHAVDGKAAPTYFPPLPGAAVTQSIDPTTVIRFILSGTQTVATDARPTALSMPGYAWKLDDAQVAAVATYVRNAWGNQAPAVSASQVANLRRKVAAKPVQKPSARI